MKTLLVTTDLSNESLLAFQTAQELAVALSAKVVLLSVVEDPTRVAMLYAMDFPILPDPEVRVQALARIKSDVDGLAKKYFGSVTCETIVQEAVGTVYQEILKQAQQLNANMIIMATHGRTGLKHLLMGSTAERVARESTRPVVIVPAKI